MTPRCFLCGARMWARTERALVFPSGRRQPYAFACGSCGVLCHDPERGGECRADLDRRLALPAFVADEAAPYGLDIYTLRTAATAKRLAAEPADDAQRAALAAPHGRLAAAARLTPFATASGTDVSLGIACRPPELGVVLDGAAAHRGWTSEIVVMVDADEVPAPVVSGTRLVARRLAGDFAGQRNALQALSDTRWMLQLDADESLDTATGALLPKLAARAERDGAVSIGLPRRNRVDGVLSEVFPDVQYRLNRRDVRYAGRVHERPERPWQQSFVALHGAIDHHLTRTRVLSRSRAYEALAPGRGRLDEETALLEPYRD